MVHRYQQQTIIATVDDTHTHADRVRANRHVNTSSRAYKHIMQSELTATSCRQRTHVSKLTALRFALGIMVHTIPLVG